MTNRKSGRTIGSTPRTKQNPGPVDIRATLQASILRNASSSFAESRIEPGDLRIALKAIPQHRLVVFVVDTSDSMGEGSTARISVAKGAIMSLLNTAYKSRDKVCMVTFQEDQARTVLPPTGSIDIAREKLRKLPIGGSTPMAKGLLECWNIIRRERQHDPYGRPILVLISDGSANAPIDRGNDPEDEIIELSRRMAADNIPAIIIETGSRKSSRLMSSIADTFDTDCYRTTKLKATRVIEMVDAVNETDERTKMGRNLQPLRPVLFQQDHQG